MTITWMLVGLTTFLVQLEAVGEEEAVGGVQGEPDAVRSGVAVVQAGVRVQDVLDQQEEGALALAHHEAGQIWGGGGGT